MLTPRTALAWLLARGLLRGLVALGVSSLGAACAALPFDSDGSTGGQSNSASGGFASDSDVGVDLASNPDLDGGLVAEPRFVCSDKLLEQGFDGTLSGARVLYSWTTAEQEATLRQTPQLLIKGEVPGLGHGLAVDRLLAHAAEDWATPAEVAVAKTFALTRYAWTNPWATRLGWPGEDYGDRLLRIELRKEAWIGLLAGTGQILQVSDLEDNVIPADQVALTPERVAALFFKRGEESGGPSCFVGSFSGTAGTGGYREFVIGNEAMIERWSIGTEEIKQRLEDDVSALSEFLAANPDAPSTAPDVFNREVTCAWGLPGLSNCYFDALSMPSDLYQPTRPRLIHLIETLSAPFTVDPLIVEPEQP